MNKPIVFNRYLNKKWAEEENEKLVNKLNQTKCKVNIKCPESYIFYKTNFKKSQTYSNSFKDAEVRRNNQFLVEKIMNIFSHPSQKKKSSYVQPNSLHAGERKLELYKIAQENQFLFKRISEKQSFYDIKKSIKDYNKTQEYKKNICIFPVIDFHQNYVINNTNTKLWDIDTYRNGFYATKNFMHDKNIENNEHTDRKVFYNKNFYITDLSNCSVKFYVENKKFVININPLSNNDISYYISFDNIEEIEKIQNIYRKYEDIINDIYLGDDGKLHINLENVKLDYRSYFVRDLKQVEIDNKDITPRSDNKVSDRGE